MAKTRELETLSWSSCRVAIFGGDGWRLAHRGCGQSRGSVVRRSRSAATGRTQCQRDPESITDPGPQNPVLASQFPSPQSPPPTDVASMPLPCASFNNASKRIQNGGCARQVTQKDFSIAEEISGVNMRLTAGGIRELHWHLAAEWDRAATARGRRPAAWLTRQYAAASYAVLKASRDYCESPLQHHR